MKCARQTTRRYALVFLVSGTLLASVRVHAALVGILGLGATASSLGFVSPDGISNSYFTGQGAVGELRLRFAPSRNVRGSSRIPYSLDMFADYNLATGQNTNGTTGESLRRTMYGSGLDYRYGPIFIGGMAEWNESESQIGGSRREFFYLGYGPRIGIVMDLFDGVSLQVGGVVLQGVAQLTINGISSSRQASESRAFALLTFELFGDTGDRPTKYKSVLMLHHER